MAYKNFCKTEILEEIGGELRKARRERKLTLAEVSEQLSARGVTLSATLLSRMENGERRIDDVTLETICSLYGVRPETVAAAASREHIRRLSPEEAAAAEAVFSPGAEEGSAAELYRNLNPEGQREVSRLMRLMAYMDAFRK